MCTIELCVWSVPDLQEAVPGTCACSHAIICDPKTAHTIVMASQHSCSVSLHGVPDVTVKVIVAGEQQTARTGEGHRGDATDDIIMRV